MAAGVALLIGYPLVRIVLGLVWVDGTLTFSAVSETLALAPDLGHTLLDTFIVTGSHRAGPGHRFGLRRTSGPTPGWASSPTCSPSSTS
ncbi:hypothetical protein SHIRM173S_07244 [Streptomyces hirsutus]